MQAILPFPDIGPELFSFRLGEFTLALRWYALAYIAGFVIGWRWLVAMMRRPALWPTGTPPMSPAQPEQLLTWIVIGTIIGGRLGFALIYHPDYYLARPGEILMIWQGGMSFHGGFLGVAVAGLLWCRVRGVPMASVADAVALATPPGLMLGRLANFVNAELWGRPSDLPWAVVFPGPAAQTCPPDWMLDICARHPSQLYQAGLEGLALGAVLVWLAYRRGALLVPGLVTGAFVTGYGVARFIGEGFRQADAQFVSPDNPFGHVIRFGTGPEAAGLTMGQALSLPMIAAGIALILWAHRRAGARA